MEEKNVPEIILEVASQILLLLEIGGRVGVDEDKENNSYIVSLDAPNESGLLIGRQGKTLEAFQQILNLAVRQRTGEWSHIVVDVADWREKEESRLTDLAMQTADRVRQSGQAQELYNLNGAQRRIVHLALANMDDIETTSEGEGENRYLVVQLKK